MYNLYVRILTMIQWSPCRILRYKHDLDYFSIVGKGLKS